MQTAVLEPRLGGRWHELSADGSQADVGKVLVWEPPARFVISWDLNSNWNPDTVLEVTVEDSPLNASVPQLKRIAQPEGLLRCGISIRPRSGLGQSRHHAIT